MMSQKYTVQYLKNGAWVDAETLEVNTMAWKGWEADKGTGAYAHLRSEERELRLRVLGDGVSGAVLRPKENVTDLVDDGETLTFTLQNPSHVSIEPSGDRVNNLMIRTAAPAKNPAYTGHVESKHVIRLGAGQHTIDNCSWITSMQGMPTLRLMTGDHLILEEGAVLRAKIVADKADNIAVTGTGIIDQSEWNPYAGKNGPLRADGMRFDNCNHIYIGDITVRNCSFFTLRGDAITDIEIDGLSSFSAVFEGDGIDFHGAIGAKIRNCFLRNSDDCIALYPDMSDIRDMEITNCVLWSDRAHTINMGTHGSRKPEDRHYITDLVFRDIDILDCNCPSPDYQGVIGISLGDESICQNLLFENFRIDDFKDSQVFLFKVMKLEPWNPNPGYRIENITVRNIFFNGDNSGGSSILGYSNDRVITGITIENLVINGKRMTSLAEAGIRTNAYTADIVIR